jgi:hypothetical protein
VRGESEVQLRRVERHAVLACAAMTVGALAGWGPWAAAAVIGGGLLIALSYVSIGTGVTAVARRLASSPAGGEGAARPPSAGRAVLVVALRYALLALLAYVMIARLRLHPIGLLAGASSVVAAAGVEAVRFLK